MSEYKKIGIIVADEDEFKPLADLVTRGKFSESEFLKRRILRFKSGSADIYAMHCGVGKVNAAAAAAHLADEGCEIMLNYGLSGGVSGIRRGEITAPNKFLEHDFDLSGIGYKLCEKPLQKYIYNADENLIGVAKKVVPALKLGTAVSGDHFICDNEVRNNLKENFNAMSCDMETAAIAYVCEFSGVPFLALRRISDDAGADATEAYREMNVSGETLLCDYIIDIIKELL